MLESLHVYLFVAVPEEKMPRLLTTSASAVRQLLRKAHLLGISDIEVMTSSGLSTLDFSTTCLCLCVQTHDMMTQTEVRRKQHLSLSFSSDFVRYYFGASPRHCR